MNNRCSALLAPVNLYRDVLDCSSATDRTYFFVSFNITILAPHDRHLLQHCFWFLLELLSDYDFLKVVGNVDGRKYVGIVSCLIDGLSSDSAGSIFAERGISVRTGLQCAPKAHKFLGTYPAGTVRLSVSALTGDKDFDELKDALDDIEAEM